MFCLILSIVYLARPNTIACNRHVVQKDDETLLRWFLALGANPNFGPDPDPEKEHDDSAYIDTSGAVLERASNSASPAIIDILLEHGANLHNSRAIHEALYRDTSADVIEMLDHLVKRGADVNHLAIHMRGFRWGARLLNIAAEIGRLEPIQWLLEHGAAPTATDRYGIPPCCSTQLLKNDEADKLLSDAYNKKLRASSEGNANGDA